MGRVLSGLLLGIVFGVYRHVDEMHWLNVGRDAFMAVQSRRFERYTEYHAAGTMLIAGILVAAILFGAYELIAAGIVRMLPPSTVEE